MNKLDRVIEQATVDDPFPTTVSDRKKLPNTITIL